MIKLSGFIGHFGPEQSPSATAHERTLYAWRKAEDVDGLVRLSDVMQMLNKLYDIAYSGEGSVAFAIRNEFKALAFQRDDVQNIYQRAIKHTTSLKQAPQVEV